MNLKKLKLVELTEQEIRETEGGFWKDLVRLEAKMTAWFIRNKDTQFVKDTFAGQDAYYP